MNINISVPHMETIETTARLFGLPKHFIAMQKGWKRIKKTSRFGYCKMQRGFEKQ